MIRFEERMTAELEPWRRKLLGHSLYGRLRSLEDLSVFMEHHVFAVWDFMSLLKALQSKMTCTSVPWLPRGESQFRRFINEIVMDEESDLLPSGKAASHFELYLEAMREVGADTSKIEAFLGFLREGQPVLRALDRAAVTPPVRCFVQQTFEMIESGQTHQIASYFTYGREDLIPDMFFQLVRHLEEQFPERLATLRYYLDRHITMDGDQHGEFGRKIVDSLRNESREGDQEAITAAVSALRARVALWDGISECLVPGAVSKETFAS